MGLKRGSHVNDGSKKGRRVRMAKGKEKRRPEEEQPRGAGRVGALPEEN